MIYDQPLKPEEQALDTGLLIRVLKTIADGGNTTNKLQPYGLSPMSGRPLVGKNVGTVMGFEGGTGIDVSEATRYYGKKGTMLRRKIRIDKCPWPRGQQNIRLRVTTQYGQVTIGAGTVAEDKVVVEKWFRNGVCQFTAQSNTAPANEDMIARGFSAGSAQLDVEIIARGVGPGNPLVQFDENPLSETFLTCIYTNPTFSAGDVHISALEPYVRVMFLPCPQFVKHRLNFSDGWVAIKWPPSGSGIGLVMGITTTIEAVGWDTGWHDSEGWHAGPPDDEYQIPLPNSYEYPNYPISDPFNPTGIGVG